MANKKLFGSTVNRSGSKAYSLDNETALAKFVMTGCFNDTFYIKAENQLNEFVSRCKSASDEYLAKLAIYSRKNGFMKDMPALLTAILSNRNLDLFSKVFSITIDNPKMLRIFVKMVRSGVSGRKSLGTKPKRLVADYLESLSDEQLFNANFGKPSMSDLIKLCHPKPKSESRSDLYKYFLTGEVGNVIPIVKEYEAFKNDNTLPVPKVPFQMLTSSKLTDEAWAEIARNATWNQTRMNLNTFARHYVFTDPELVNVIVNRLQDEDLIKASKVMPYEIMAAYNSLGSDVPDEIREALSLALDSALMNVPKFDGKVHVLIDVSGSMNDSATGGYNSSTTCIDVAALFASAILRVNPDANVLPFDTSVHDVNINPYNSVFRNAKYLASFGGGGTDCACALAKLNGHKQEGDVVIFVSDNESNVNFNPPFNQTRMSNEWNKFKKSNPKAKLINIDIRPNSTTQSASDSDIMNIGGFNDSVFLAISNFLNGNKSIVEQINDISI